ncbi:RNA-directed DNA polymerase, eukaryota [Artemisia annua]|uniref:RNA-directed DNA polymerase, eukaryota n=1 Tax=Artemisia annua TaxID=35608 RepID=A0A2U1PE10_ARTAN|nr:RNA-directed DNA polymerase, eukaryota [Artemisia annua]
MTHNDHNSIWAKVIKSIHSRDGGFGTSDRKPFGNGVWASIVKVVDQMHEKQIMPLGSMALHVGNGHNVSFWNDVWVGDYRLRDKFPRLYDMESNKECFIAERWVEDQWVWSWNRSIRSGSRIEHQLMEMLAMLMNVNISDTDDKWKWEFELDGIFSVRSVRKIIDSSFLTSGNIVTRWCSNVPIKVNIMMWRLMWDRLPTRMNLAAKDIDIPSVLCPICNNEIESSDHTFFKCDTAVHLWRMLSRWCELNLPGFDNTSSMLSWLESIGVQRRRILEVILYTTVWCIWRFRNGVVFKDSTMKKSFIFESIVINSYHWFSSRCKKHISWTLWLQNPMLHFFV